MTMHGMYASQADDQAQAMAIVVEQNHPGALARLRVDPVAELHLWDELSVSLVAETVGAEGCSVAGSYQSSPPTLIIAASRSSGRRNITALHELGHHLQRTDIDLGNNLFQHGDPEQLEEQSCDTFAARILLPDDDLFTTIDARGPTAQEVVDLFTRSSASREACCVWAARHLLGSGVVVLLDSSGAVLFAAPKGFVPPAKRSDQSQTPLIAAALRHPGGGGAARDDTYFVYRTGAASDSLFGEARWFDDEYLVAVCVTDNVPWKKFAPPQRPQRRDDRGPWWDCETCGKSFVITERCDHCQVPRCPDQHCGCDAARIAREKQCAQCFTFRHRSQFKDGSDICNDCTGM